MLLRIRQNLVRVPPGVEIEDFGLNDGKVVEPHEAVAVKLGLGQLIRRYLETHGNGSFETTSLKTARLGVPRCSAETCAGSCSTPCPTR